MNYLYTKYCEATDEEFENVFQEIENSVATFLDSTEIAAINELFADLGSDTDRRYEKYFVCIVRATGNVKKLTEKLGYSLKRDDISKETRYAIFYCLNQAYRLFKDFDKSAESFNRFGGEFKDFSSYNHIEILLSLNRTSFLTEEELNELLVNAKEDARHNSNNSGYVHLFADFVATVYEEGRGRLDLREKWLSEGIESARACCQYLAPEYPKFHATYGRLLALRANEETDDLSLARQEIQKAMVLEPSYENDYAIRIGQYQADLLKVQAAEQKKKAVQINNENKEQMAAFEKKLDEGLEEINRSKISNLEFLGFFTALISFTIGSISFTQSFAPTEAAKLIVILAGALLFAFGGFTIIVCRSTKEILAKAVPIIVIGLVIVLLGFALL